jgi:hypothetical protein
MLEDFGYIEWRIRIIICNYKHDTKIITLEEEINVIFGSWLNGY